MLLINFLCTIINNYVNFDRFDNGFVYRDHYLKKKKKKSWNEEI